MNGAQRGLRRWVRGEMPVVLTVEEMSRWPWGSATTVERVRRASRLAVGRESVGERRTGRGVRLDAGGLGLVRRAYRVFR
jgi:hypothetical protein